MSVHRLQRIPGTQLACQVVGGTHLDLYLIHGLRPPRPQLQHPEPRNPRLQIHLLLEISRQQPPRHSREIHSQTTRYPPHPPPPQQQTPSPLNPPSTTPGVHLAPPPHPQNPPPPPPPPPPNSPTPGTRLYPQNPRPQQKIPGAGIPRPRPLRRRTRGGHSESMRQKLRLRRIRGGAFKRGGKGM